VEEACLYEYEAVKKITEFHAYLTVQRAQLNDDTWLMVLATTLPATRLVRVDIAVQFNKDSASRCNLPVSQYYVVRR
jgi:hypothetical protein